eukprot:2314573-Amphidinium_carterae.2
MLGCLLCAQLRDYQSGFKLTALLCWRLVVFLAWDATPSRPARMAPLPARATVVEEGVATTEENLGAERDSTVVLAQRSVSESLPAPSQLQAELLPADDGAMAESETTARSKRQREESQGEAMSSPSGTQKRPAETSLDKNW